MIVKLFINPCDSNGLKIDCKFVDEKNNIIATATNNINEHTTLYYNDNKYELINYPKKLKRFDLNVKYPLCSKRKWTIGFEFKSNDKVVASTYHEALTVGKKFVFKKNMGLDITYFENKIFQTYKVGFTNENHHNYCIYDDKGNTVGIIRRFYGEEYRAILYIETEDYLLLTLLVALNEIIDYADFNTRDMRVDPSAGNYISILKEEKEMFDKNFIEKIEHNK